MSPAAALTFHAGGALDSAAVLLKTWTVGEIAFANNAWTGTTFAHNPAAATGTAA